MEASRRRFLLVLAAAVFASPAIFWASAELPPDFCASRRLFSPPAASRRRCPAAPTAASLDLPTLLGSYYEIGSSARYKIKYELGMACSRTSFSPSSPSPGDGGDGDGDDDDDDDSGDSTTTFSDSGDSSPTSSVGGRRSPRINVVTTGVPVVFGRQTLEAVARIASSAANVCVTAERLCAMSMPQSRTAEALLRIAAVSDQIADASSLETAALAQATGVVNASVLAVQSCLDRLARSVSVVATMNAGLSQKVGGAGATDVLLRQVRASAEEGMEQARRVGSLVISNLTFASDLVEMASSRLAVSEGGGTTGDAASLLEEASALLQAEIQHISAQVTTIQGLLSSVGGPLADMVEAEERSEAAVGSSAEAEAAANASRVVLRNGEAVEEGGEGGNLVLQEAVAGNVAAAEVEETPFRVLAVVPPDGGEYAAVLIETCDARREAAAFGEAAGGAASKSELIILSRTRTLTPDTVLGLLSGAASNGVFADCDSPFVLTLQSPDDCSDSSN